MSKLTPPVQSTESQLPDGRVSHVVGWKGHVTTTKSTTYHSPRCNELVVTYNDPLNKPTIPLDAFSASERHVTKEPDALLRRQAIQEGLHFHRDVTRTSEVLLGGSH